MMHKSPGKKGWLMPHQGADISGKGNSICALGRAGSLLRHLQRNMGATMG